jgi:hypothetical protein
LAFFSATLVSDEADHADRYLPAGIDAPHAPPHGADAPPGQAPAQKGPKEGRNLAAMRISRRYAALRFWPKRVKTLQRLSKDER